LQSLIKIVTLSLNSKLIIWNDKSLVDDLKASRYCKCESGLCPTIH